MLLPLPGCGAYVAGLMGLYIYYLFDRANKDSTSMYFWKFAMHESKRIEMLSNRIKGSKRPL
jgi:hypothetical protein